MRTGFKVENRQESLDSESKKQEEITKKQETKTYRITSS
ncbi:hypothetical protein ZPR_2963 [Zunongwangia profunda SM-A87]|uniref:Uncharacterized protein n=1 Tax=Zunongwangia profunda (strain DSM 18752 / CCTCC AB 206139 / SM-A87) TaxID=655815 RepID=D5BGV2_ZUNPS|nr:hypothetical protein ZPR_2963 [Zunongwangia profunda SM-A87]